MCNKCHVGRLTSEMWRDMHMHDVTWLLTDGFNPWDLAQRSQSCYHWTTVTCSAISKEKWKVSWKWKSHLLWCMCNCLAGHSFVSCTCCQAVILEVCCTYTQQQTSWQSAQLLDPLVGEARQKCNGISTGIYIAANCNSVIVVSFYCTVFFTHCDVC